MSYMTHKKTDIDIKLFAEVSNLTEDTARAIIGHDLNGDNSTKPKRKPRNRKFKASLTQEFPSKSVIKSVKSPKDIT